MAKRRKHKRNPDRNGIDRLSNLPEHLLLHILSFLPTETAVSTTVLSKTWQFLWTLVPNLDFDQSRRHEYQYESFVNFVTKALLHRRERFIRRFSLKCEPYQYSSDMDSWVSSAIAQNVQELDLNLGDHTYDPLFWRHCSKQSFKNLVVLKLSSDAIFPDHDFEEKYQDTKFLPSMFPVLEELVITHELGFFETNFEICLPKLRSLAIDKSNRKGFVQIDCPGLTHLVIKDKKSRRYYLENLPSLVEADINVRPRVLKSKDRSYGKYVINVVKAISNVRILRMFRHTMEAISSYLFFRLDDIPVFHNLVRVELPFVGSAQEIIIAMLQKFENLECLILRYKGIGRPKVDTKELIKQNHVPSCLTSRLNSFCFRGFRGTNDEMEFTRYILENSRVLENMTIFLSSSLSTFGGKDLIRKKFVSSYPPRGVDLIFLRKKMKVLEGDVMESLTVRLL